MENQIKCCDKHDLENTIQRGDQYAILFELTFDEEPVTPENTDDVRIQIGNILKSYSDNELSFDVVDNLWIFDLTEQQTRALGNTTMWQFAVKVGSNFYHSDNEVIFVKESLIKKDWGNNT